jgi:transposase
LAVSIVVEGTNLYDMKLVQATIAHLVVPRPVPTADHPQGMCMDKGYDYQEVRDLLGCLGFTAHIRSRGEEAKAITREKGYTARRWMVERAHSWFNRFRRLLVRWEKKAENYLALLQFACGLMVLRTMGLFG